MPESIPSIPQHAVTISAHQTVVLWGLAQACPGQPTKVVVELLKRPPHLSPIEVTPSFVSLETSGLTCRIPVELTNNTSRSVSLPPKAVLASLQVASEVCEAQDQPTVRNSVDIDLSSATLSPEQAEQVKAVLGHMSYVFAQGGSDLGNTTEITHEIRLTDDISVWEPHCRVLPTLLDQFGMAV